VPVVSDPVDDDAPPSDPAADSSPAAVTVGAGTFNPSITGTRTSTGVCTSAATEMSPVRSDKSLIEIAPVFAAIVPTPIPVDAVIPAMSRGS